MAAGGKAERLTCELLQLKLIRCDDLGQRRQLVLEDGNKLYRAADECRQTG